MISQRRQGDMDPVDRHRDSHRHKKAPQMTTHPFRWCRHSAPKALSSGRREQLDGAFERLPYLQALASYFGLDFSPPLSPSSNSACCGGGRPYLLLYPYFIYLQVSLFLVLEARKAGLRLLPAHLGRPDRFTESV